MKKLLLPLLFAIVAFAGSPKVAYYAPVPPPPARVEARGLPPAPNQVWIAGYWAYENGRHMWRDGHWEKPPRPNARYIEPRWDRKGNQYAFREGRWK
jgi:WXXGXW repeat (2 copies)